MTELIICENCGGRFPNNPDKHRYRSKYCPYCRVAYTGAQKWLPSISFRSIRKSFQKIFSFFPKRSDKEVYWQCPKCGHLAYGKSQFKLRKYPDKTKTAIIDGKSQTIVLSYREVPTCPECYTHLIRKKR
jgi:DNA-directed RNA polymerase subunit RPC12/RpoP